ncbi:MAG: N-acetylgalactosamine-6-sulfatase [Planctomycetaceae bacterium]|nr:N-acetylgalactosamine-6-sulfatase [Planctomycetaceae bacterium]
MTNTYRSFTLILLALAVIASARDASAEQPNIVLLMGDDHGWDEVGYNGHPQLKTPVLAEMVATGLRLDRFYSAHPSCSPTRGSVITGRHPIRYGTLAPNWSIRPEEISVAQILAKAGYQCGHFGKWHLGPVKSNSPTSPGAMGFHQWLSHDNFFELNPTLSRNGGPPEKFTGESSEIIIDETIRFIGEAQESGKPFFAVVWYGSPHEPYSGLPDDLALYDDLPKSYQDKKVKLTSNKTGRPTTRTLREVLRERFAEITAMDRSIGKLRDYLKSKGLRDNTLLWYCGDNGVPRSGLATSPFRGVKGTVYEAGIRVPGVIEWPAKIKKPKVSSVNTVTSDMLPTICELTNQPLPQRPLDGISLVPLLDGKMEERSRPICVWNYNSSQEFLGEKKPWIQPELQQGTTPLVKMLGGRYTRNFQNFHHPKISEPNYAGARALISNQYKLVVTGSKGKQKIELFDLRKDAAEAKDLAKSKPEIAKQLGKELRSWQHSVLTSFTGADYPSR